MRAALDWLGALLVTLAVGAMAAHDALGSIT
jgi:hypothetical protein